MALEVTVKSVRGLKGTDAPRVVPQVSRVVPQVSLAFEIKHRSGIFVPDSAYFWMRECRRTSARPMRTFAQGASPDSTMRMRASNTSGT